MPAPGSNKGLSYSIARGISLDEVPASILRKLEAIESWSAAGDEQLAADQRGYAARG